MNNKLSELSKPVAYIADCGTIVSDGDPFFDDYKNPQPIYSQEYVSALLARIAELEGGSALLTNQRDLWYGKVQDLEAKLATPVRLPDVLFIKVSGSAVPVMHATRVKERIRAAGFTVGDE